MSQSGILTQEAIESSSETVPISFSDFTIESAKQRLGLRLDDRSDFFAGAPPASVSSLLRETLRENVPLALKISTEKARSELIIAPVLLEVRRHLAQRISLFSGIEWSVDPARGLCGVCNFLLSLSAEQLELEAPVVAVVETGIGQCLAEMVGAQLFNQQHNNGIATVYGVVTTGNIWKFLRLVGSKAFIHEAEYHIHQVEKVVGIMVSMFNVQVSPCATPPSA
jgi:hypothetical protein